MSGLFDDEPQPVKSLKIVKGAKKVLSKMQALFNKLTERIEELQIRNIQEKAKLDKLLNNYAEKMVPVEIELAHDKIKLAKALADSMGHNKYGKKQVESIRQVITALCIEAFKVVKPDEELEKFFDTWAQVTYKETREAEQEEAKEELADFLYFHFGVNIDPDEIGNTPEELARFAKNMQERFGKDAGETADFNEPKKTKKQLAQEAAQKKEEDVKLKSIRNIYIGLAKVLHPDTESDPALKVQKEELMKKVTVAYNEQDLSTLLKLEMEWVHQQARHLEEIPDSKLGIYVSFLKEQVSTLEQERYMLYHDPRYLSIEPFMQYSEKQAKQVLSMTIANLKDHSKELQQGMRIFSKPGSKKQVMEFVELFIEAMEDDESADYFDEEYFYK